jgi:hypothetical protein
MPPPILSALPIAKSILYEKRILLSGKSTKKRSFTEKILIPKVVLGGNGYEKK